MTTDDLIKFLNSVGPMPNPTPESPPKPTELPTVTITPSKLLELVGTLNRHSNNIELLVDVQSKLGKLSNTKRSLLNFNSVSFQDHYLPKLVEYDTVIQQMLVVSNQINLQYNLMVTSILEVLEGNG